MNNTVFFSTRLPYEFSGNDEILEMVSKTARLVWPCVCEGMRVRHENRKMPAVMIGSVHSSSRKPAADVSVLEEICGKNRDGIDEAIRKSGADFSVVDRILKGEGSRPVRRLSEYVREYDMVVLDAEALFGSFLQDESLPEEVRICLKITLAYSFYHAAIDRTQPDIRKTGKREAGQIIDGAAGTCVYRLVADKDAQAVLLYAWRKHLGDGWVLSDGLLALLPGIENAENKGRYILAAMREDFAFAGKILAEEVPFRLYSYIFGERPAKCTRVFVPEPDNAGISMEISDGPVLQMLHAVGEYKEVAEKTKKQEDLETLLHKYSSDKFKGNDIDFYNAARVDRKMWSALVGKKHGEKARENIVLAFAVAARLSLDETVELMAAAGHSFPRPHDRWTGAIAYYIENEQENPDYGVDDINYEMLEIVFKDEIEEERKKGKLKSKYLLGNECWID